MSVVATPENALYPHAGLHALIQYVGCALYFAYLYEHKYWGSSDGNSISDPNPRMEAVIDAARRGGLHLQSSPGEGWGRRRDFFDRRPSACGHNQPTIWIVTTRLVLCKVP